MPFQPGNKLGRGRPKVNVDVVALARARTKDNIENLAYWADQREDGAVAVRANIALHEIAWGKAQLVVAADGISSITIRLEQPMPVIGEAEVLSIAS